MARQWPAAKPHIASAGNLTELVKLQRGLIVGPSGSGKTTLLRRLALFLLERKDGLAVVVDLREQETWSHLNHPAVLAAHALSLPSTASDCERLLASGGMTLLLDHAEFLPAPALLRLTEAITLIPQVFIAVPAWCTTYFRNLPRYDMPLPKRDILAAITNQEQANALDNALTFTPLGLSILASLSCGDKVQAAQDALSKLIEHAHLSLASTDVIETMQILVISLAFQGVDPRMSFHPSELLLKNITDDDLRLLLLAGLLDFGTTGYRLSYPDLALASIQRNWLPVMLGLVSCDNKAAVTTAARLIAVDEDNFTRMFLPELVGAVEQGLLPPDLVIGAILNLSEQTISRHVSFLRVLIDRLDEAWQHIDPDDSHRQQSIRNAIFLLKRHTPPRIEQPIEDINGEIACLLASAEGKLDREQVCKAVCLADVASTKNVANLILVVDFFDTHPECQADVLIGCLKAETASGFDLFVSLLQRATFCATSSAGYVAAAFPDWKDQFSLSLLHTYVQDDDLQADDVSHRFARAVCAHLTLEVA
jgi:energy-coupling factor transporter ATP-binding protein EcfA2